METSNTNQLLADMQKEMRSLKRRFFFLTIIIISVLGSFLYMTFSKNQAESFQKLRTKELIVEDQNGNDRIILSSVISKTKSRIRTDTLEGVLFLDDKGIDRVSLGATPNVQSNGKVYGRVDKDIPYGYFFNDEKGNERGGFGYYSGRKIVVFGMDYPGHEGLVMFVAEKEWYGQKVGLLMNDDNHGQRVYLGSTVIGESMLNIDTPSKGRVSLTIDSTGKHSGSYFDFRNGSEKKIFE